MSCRKRLSTLDRGAFQSSEFGAGINLKATHFALVCAWLAAALCAGQSAPQPATADAKPSAQPPANSSGQTPAQTAPPTQPPAGQPAPPADQGQGKDSGVKSSTSATSPATSKDRLFFALPNFLTVENAGKIPPLTAGQKFRVVARGSFDPAQIVWYGALSGISQAENSEPGYKQGAEGYGKRYGTFAADGTIENFFVGAILPSVLHQDPRFFPKAQGSFFGRAGYAASRILITRGDSGHRQFNFSEVIGAAIASGISTYSYHPGRTFIGYNDQGW